MSGSDKTLVVNTGRMRSRSWRRASATWLARRVGKVEGLGHFSFLLRLSLRFPWKYGTPADGSRFFVPALSSLHSLYRHVCTSTPILAARRRIVSMTIAQPRHGIHMRLRVGLAPRPRPPVAGANFLVAFR